MYQDLYSLQTLLFKWLEISNVAKNSSKWQFVENNKKKPQKASYWFNCRRGGNNSQNMSWGMMNMSVLTNQVASYSKHQDHFSLDRIFCPKHQYRKITLKFDINVLVITNCFKCTQFIKLKSKLSLILRRKMSLKKLNKNSQRFLDL